MPQIEVYCTVQNCDFWGKNNHCMADKILIVHDAQAAAWPDAVDHPMGSNLQQATADTCMETACKTFRHRHDNAGPAQDRRANNQQMATKYPHQ